ncbi:MAG: hypothetical protein KC620_20235, partial [Myxococcales bacterium]|nr:hypothetical protein [Myxococcales bacterium]
GDVRGLYAPRPRGDVMRAMADLARRRGQLDRADRFAAEAALHYERAADRRAQAWVALIRGDLQRYRGQFEEATGFYRDAGRLLRAVGSAEAVIADLNQGLVLIELDQFREARAVFEMVVDSTERRPSLTRWAQACLLPCDAYAGDWRAFDARWFALAPLREGQLADPDLAWLAGLAARFAAAAGEHERAAMARSMAVAQFDALGWAEAAAALRVEG